MAEKILIVGNGAREYSLGKKIKDQRPDTEVFFAPGNGGTELNLGVNIPDLKPTDIEPITHFAVQNNTDLVIIGPETALAPQGSDKNLVDLLIAENIPAFGPTRAATLEKSKIEQHYFNIRHHIPQAEADVCYSFDQAMQAVKKRGVKNSVIKADGFMKGKGVWLEDTEEEVEQILRRAMIDGEFDESATAVLIAERLVGPEISFMAFCDGKRAVPMIPAADYKRLHDDDRGPNTGGMGAYARLKLPRGLASWIQKNVIEKALAGAQKDGNPIKGVLYAGIMLTPSGPKVIEYNSRLGDPETQVVFPLLNRELVDIIDACINETLSTDLVDFANLCAVGLTLAADGYPNQARIGDEITHYNDIDDPNVHFAHAGTAFKNGKLVTDGGRVGTLVAIDSTRSQARKLMYAKAAHHVLFDLRQKRSDIARTERFAA
jgi:phosphoribosylamine---glycine ligase